MDSESNPSSCGVGVVFPGQGCQKPGMGRDFYGAFSSAREVFEEASDGAGVDLAALSFADDDPRLGLTEYCQPAVLATEVAIYRSLVDEFGLQADTFAGHSLGEYAALVAAGVVDLVHAARIVRERGRLMQDAVPVGIGSMLAVIGPSLDRAAVFSLIDGLSVDIANDNSSEQIVLSGRSEDIAVVADRMRSSHEDWRLAPLDVSAPFHSRLLAGIEPAFREVLEDPTVAWHGARAKSVACNYTGEFYVGVGLQVIRNLEKQISRTVLWRRNMEIIADRSEYIYELGPGRPLRGFFRTIDRDVASVTTVRAAEKAFLPEVPREVRAV